MLSINTVKTLSEAVSVVRPILEKILKEIEEGLPKCPICGEKMLPHRKACSAKCLKKLYYRRNRSKILRKSKEYRIERRDEYLKRSRDYYRRNRDRILEYVKRYRKRYVRYRYKWLGKVVCKKCGKPGYGSLIDMQNLKTGYRKITCFVQHDKITHVFDWKF